MNINYAYIVFWSFRWVLLLLVLFYCSLKRLMGKSFFCRCNVFYFWGTIYWGTALKCNLKWFWSICTEVGNYPYKYNQTSVFMLYYNFCTHFHLKKMILSVHVHNNRWRKFKCSLLVPAYSYSTKLKCEIYSTYLKNFFVLYFRIWNAFSDSITLYAYYYT